MKNIFIPAGEVIYLGTNTELANEIYNLHGKIEDNGDFKCEVSVPKSRREEGISLGASTKPLRTSFGFRGRIFPFKEGYKITYKVYPTIWSVAYLLVLLYFFVQAFAGWSGSWQQLGGRLLAFGFVSAIVIAVFLITRHLAIRQFVKRFQDDWVADDGIF